MIAEASLLAAVLLPNPLVETICDTTTPVPVFEMMRAAPDLEDLYQNGQTFEEFLAEADRRREQWEGNWSRSDAIDAGMVARAAAVDGDWHFLVVAVDSCSDSVSTIPYLARLVADADNLHMRIVDPEAGKDVMASHRTPDGRPSTPTVVLLNEDFEEVGCFIERPTWLRDHIIENPDDLDRSGIFEMKMKWYDDNAGADTIEDMVTMLEAAGRGEVHCASSSH